MDSKFSLDSSLTYKSLFNVLDAYREKHGDHVSIKIGDEYYELDEICISSKENDILDEGHIYLVVKN